MMTDSWNDVWPNFLFPWRMADSFDAMLTGFVAPASAPQCGQAQRAGAFTTERYTDPSGSRDYKLYIPSAYAGQALPLVVMLHGCGQNADEFARDTRMNALAEEQQCFVVYPEQASSANCARCWNWFNLQDQRRGQGEPAIIAGIALDVIDAYGIDSERVFIAGLSAGGAMAVILGCTYPDVFKAVGCHSGLPYGAATDACSALGVMRNGSPCMQSLGPQDRVPVIVFHGDGDNTVHPSHGAGVISQSLAALPSQRSVRQGVSSGRAYTRTVHRHPDGGAIAEEWVVHGAGHVWCGAGTGSGPDAGAEMLRFFMEDSRCRGMSA